MFREQIQRSGNVHASVGGQEGWVSGGEVDYVEHEQSVRVEPLSVLLDTRPHDLGLDTQVVSVCTETLFDTEFSGGLPVKVGVRLFEPPIPGTDPKHPVQKEDSNGRAIQFQGLFERCISETNGKVIPQVLNAFLVRGWDRVWDGTDDASGHIEGNRGFKLFDAEGLGQVVTHVVDSGG